MTFQGKKIQNRLESSTSPDDTEEAISITLSGYHAGKEP